MAKKAAPAPDTIAGYIANSRTDPARAIIRARVAAQTPTLARIVRRLAGTFYRSAQWSKDTTRHERAAGFQCAAIVRRASAPRDWPDTWNLIIHAGPVPYHAGHGARQIPGSLVIEAGRIDATDARAAALDVVTDALIGLATFAGCDGRRWLSAWSVYGFGATMPDPEQWCAASVSIAWAEDELSEYPAAQRFAPIAVRCRSFAVEILAAQFAAEAAEPTRSPLARARRVAAVARLTRRAPVAPYGADELAEALRDYGARHVDAAGNWTDAHGSDAWETFRTEQDARHDAGSTRGGTRDLDAAAEAQRQAGLVAQDDEFRSEMRDRQKAAEEDAAEGDAAEGDAMHAAALDAAEAIGQVFDGAAQADRAQDDRKYDPIEVN